MERGNVGNDHLRRCVIIAAPGSETSALTRALSDRGVDCLLAEDIAPGGEISREILKELAATDFVVASLHGETSPGLAFELGVAHALRKPMIAFTTNHDHLLDDLLGTYVVRKAPVAGPEFADDIDRFLRHATTPPPVDQQPPSRPPADFAWARERAALLKVEGGADRGLALEQLVTELFEAVGDPIIRGKERPDRGVDLIAWDKEAGGSLIIECKHYSGGAGSTVANLKHTVEKLEHMVLNSDARMALLVLSSDHPRQPARLPETPRVSIVRIETLIDALESGHLMAEITHRRHNATPTRGWWVPPVDAEWVHSELAAIEQGRTAAAKGKRVERLVRQIFGRIPGLVIEDQDVISAYRTQEIDLYYFNRRDANGLHFLDCPLIVECKGWSGPVDGRELRYFADLLRDRGRRDGIFIALHGITGNPDTPTAGFYHVATALAGGQLVLVITGDDLRKARGPADLVALLQRRMLDQVKSQILAIERTAEGRPIAQRSRRKPAGR